MLIQNLLERSAAGKPGNTAVGAGGHSIDYRDLNGKSSYLAGQLRENGCKPGDKIALLLDKSIETIAAVFGILKSGAAYIPLDSDSTANRLEYIVRDIGARLIITNQKKRATAKKSPKKKTGENSLHRFAFKGIHRRPGLVREPGLR